MASWGRGRGDGVYARLAAVQSNIFWHCTWVRLFLVLCAAQRAAAGWRAGRGLWQWFLRTSLEEKSQRALAALYFTVLYKLVSYRPLAREMRPRLKVGTAVYDQRAHGLLSRVSHTSLCSASLPVESMYLGSREAP